MDNEKTILNALEEDRGFLEVCMTALKEDNQELMDHIHETIRDWVPVWCNETVRDNCWLEAWANVSPAKMDNPTPSLIRKCDTKFCDLMLNILNNQ